MQTKKQISQVRKRVSVIALSAAVLVAMTGIAVFMAVRADSAASFAELRVSGKTVAESHIVAAPSIPYPEPDYGISTDDRELAAGGAGPAKQPPGALVSGGALKAPQVSGRITDIRVELGDLVKSGQILASLDTRLLKLGVEAARADLRRARADVLVLSQQLEEVSDKQDEVASARGKLSRARSTLGSASSQLRRARTSLVSARSKVVAARSALKKQIGALEAAIAAGQGGPSGGDGGGQHDDHAGEAPATDSRTVLKQLRAKLAQVEAGLKKIDAGLTKVAAGRARVSSGFRKLASASSRLSNAESSLQDARSALTDAREILRVVADGRRVGVRYAQTVLGMATLSSPADGVVTYIADPSSVVMSGAPVIRLRSESATRVVTYLTAEQLAGVSAGTDVEVRVDASSSSGYADADVATVASSYRFPPSSMPTELIHMTRAAQVIAALRPGSTLPAGVPADLTIKRIRSPGQ